MASHYMEMRARDPGRPALLPEARQAGEDRPCPVACPFNVAGRKLRPPAGAFIVIGAVFVAVHLLAWRAP